MMQLSSRCPDCPAFYQPISGNGPIPSRMLLIGERPGKKENEGHEVFIGPTGQELDETYLALAGMDRGDVRVENAVRCWAENNRTPSPAEVRSCAGHFLPRTIDLVQPEFLVLMGGSACRIADFPIRLEMHHGRPLWGSVLGGKWEGWVWPSYHPAAGMRDGKMMTGLLEDFANLGRWLGEEGWWPRQAGEVEVDYRYANTCSDLVAYLDCYAGILETACDTETHGKEKWSIQISHTPHTGRMILAGNKPVVDTFRDWTRATSAEWLFHYAAHDMDELDRYGIGPITNWRDTMQESYHQTNLPQGLKPLAYRLLGVTMRSWEDVVWPASITAMVEWMQAGVVVAGVEQITETKTLKCMDCGHRHSRGPCGKLGCGCVSTNMTNLKTEYKLSTAGSILKHLLRYTTAEDQDLDTPYHPWKKLEQMKIDGLRGKTATTGEWQAIEEVLGPTPVLGIGNAEAGEQLRYAVGDADMTGQVATELARMRQEQARVRVGSVTAGGAGGLMVDEEDWDQ